MNQRGNRFKTKTEEIEFLKDLLRKKDKVKKDILHNLKRHQQFIKKINKIKNKRLRDLEHIPDYSLRSFRLRKQEVTSFYNLLYKEIKKQNLGWGNHLIKQKKKEEIRQND